MIMESNAKARQEQSNRDIAIVVAELAAEKLRSEHPVGSGTMPRDAHPKSHGLVIAEVIVDNSVPAALRIGPFAKPRTFKAYIRFSNGSPSKAPDGRPDLRGMAIKLVGVEGRKVMEDELDAITHDIVVCSHPTFFVKTAEDYVGFFKAISQGLVKLHTQFFFPSLKPWLWRPREFWNFWGGLLRRVPSLAEIRYWSQTPYAFGDKVIKYSVSPRSCPVYVPVDKKDPNKFRNTMVRQLQNGDIIFDLMVQTQIIDGSMPIEDSRIRWSERRSPFRKVATIRVPSQEFDTEERKVIDENLSFTPWHSLWLMRPLGAINEVRRVVYQTISKLRHSFNGVPRKEPVD